MSPGENSFLSKKLAFPVIEPGVSELFGWGKKGQKCVDVVCD